MIAISEIPEDVLRTIRDHCERDYPDEACGVVFAPGGGLVVFASENCAADPAHHFRIGAPEMAYIARRIMHGDRLAVIYHSHCDVPAIFSVEDRQYAKEFPDVLHLVLAVTTHGVVAMHAYDSAGQCADESVEIPA